MADFIGDRITVTFATSPVVVKRPPAPSSFSWRGRVYEVDKVLSQWEDFQRPTEQRSIFERAPFNLRAGGRHASWGFGKTYFRVRAFAGRGTSGEVSEVFELFYDRRPEGKSRLGSWTLYRRLSEQDLETGKIC